MGCAMGRFQVGGGLGLGGTARLALGVVLFLAAPADRAQGQATKTQQSTEAAAPSLARYVPSQNLIFFLEFDGLDAHSAAWHGSAAYKVLNETKLGALLENLAAQAIDLALESAHPEQKVKASDIINQVKRLARDGFVFAVWGTAPDDLRVIFVLRNGDQPGSGLLPAAAAADGGGREDGANADARPLKKSGRTLYPLGRNGIWWAEKGDLVLTGANKVDEILEVLDGKRANAVDHPLRVPLAKPRKEFQVVARGFLDLSALPPLPPGAARLGLDGLKRIELTWGFQTTGQFGPRSSLIRTVLRVVAPAPRRGILALLDQPSFLSHLLPPLPPGQTDFTVLSIDFAKTFDQVVAMAKESNARLADQIARLEDAIWQGFGAGLRNDLLATFGPQLAVYAQPTASKAGADPISALVSRSAGLTLSIHVRDRAKATRLALDPLIGIVNRVLTHVRVQGDQPGGKAPVLEFRRQAGPDPTYVLDIPPGLLPAPFQGVYQPTVMLAENQLVISATTAAAQRAVTACNGGPDKRVSQNSGWGIQQRALPRELVLFNVTDPRESVAALIESLPAVAKLLSQEIEQAQRRQGRPAPGFSLQIDPAQVPSADELRRLLMPAMMGLEVDAEGASLIAREPIPIFTAPLFGGVLAAFVLPAIQSARDAARHAERINDHKQVALAMDKYHDVNTSFTKLAITDKKGKPVLSGTIAILPWIE